MKIYAITVKPESAFGTPFKGDTLFGHFCWQVVHDDSLLSGGLDTWIDQYADRPFTVFSSAFLMIGNENTRYVCLPRPSMPDILSNDMPRKKRVELRKKNKKNKWLIMPLDRICDDPLNFETCNDIDLFHKHREFMTLDQKRIIQFLPEDQQKPLTTFTQAHNSINRLTMTTDEDFAPFSMENFHYMPFARLVIFAGIDDEALDETRLRNGMERIGIAGFGRDASTGLGRFSVENIEKIANWPAPASRPGCYVLAPCVPEEDKWAEQFAIPFTRFGRHGCELVLTGKPFKNPVVMADEGSVFFPEEEASVNGPYIGRAVQNLSLIEPRTVSQGYSLYLPVSRRNI